MGSDIVSECRICGKTMNQTEKTNIAQQIIPYLLNNNRKTYKANDGRDYLLHIEGLEGAECPCVLEDKTKQLYEIIRFEDNKIFFKRHGCFPPIGSKIMWFGPLCGEYEYCVDLNLVI